MRVVIIIVVILIAAFSFYLFFTGRRNAEKEALPQQNKKSMSETVRLKTQDSVEIVGDYYSSGSATEKGILLLHMMPADRKSWDDFAQKLQAAGFAALAIDLRGHGESQGGPDGYKSFSDSQLQASKLDVEAAAEFLGSKGIKSLYLVGASIGAILSLQYLAEHPEVKSAVLLSPGLDYRGIKTESFAKLIRPNQGVYFAASGEDMRSSGQSATDMADVLFNLCNCKKEIKKFEEAGHGTTIFERNPAFMDEVVSWLMKN